MPVKVRGEVTDKRLQRIVGALEEYAAAHPRAQIEAYRHNAVSVRVRVVDPTFKGMTRVQREEDIWAVLERLPEETVSEVSILLLLTPQEAKKSIANMDFEDPIPTAL
jgi:stress-induced morphogen